MASGLVFNIQKYSVQDGPGIRTTVFLKGCPLHCAWCHNPESISPKPEIVVLESRCIGCSECRLACKFASEPLSSAGRESGPLPARNERCDLCGECVEACPTQARQMAGREMTVEEVLQAVLADRIFYEDSGGGVTFSGGEPLVQMDFLLELLQTCKRQGVHTCVDTCGLAAPEKILAIAPHTDLFLYDIKLIDEHQHLRYTGATNGRILDNLQMLSRVHENIWVRVPVIPGVNDTREDLQQIAGFVRTLKGLRQVNLLPYHQNGLEKLRRLGQKPRMPDIRPPTAEFLAEAVDLFGRHGIVAKAGG